MVVINFVTHFVHTICCTYTCTLWTKSYNFYSLFHHNGIFRR